MPLDSSMFLFALVQLGSSDPVRASLDAASGKPIEVIWEAPGAAPRGIFFAAHGCQHSAGDFWWSSDDTCSGCLGLPEELRIVKAALSRVSFLSPCHPPTEPRSVGRA